MSYSFWWWQLQQSVSFGLFSDTEGLWYPSKKQLGERLSPTSIVIILTYFSPAQHDDNYFYTFRDEVIVNEVAESRDPKLVTFTSHTFLQQAQDDNHDYESLPLQDFPPDLPARTKEPTTTEQESNGYVDIPFLATAHDAESKPRMLDNDYVTSDIKSTDTTLATSEEPLYEDMGGGQASVIPEDKDIDTESPAKAKEPTLTEKVSNEYVEVPSLTAASALESKPQMLDGDETTSDMKPVDIAYAPSSSPQESPYEDVGCGQAKVIPEDENTNTDLPAPAEESTATEQVGNEYVEVPSLAMPRVPELQPQTLDSVLATSDAKLTDITHSSAASLHEDMGQADAIPEDKNTDT